MKNQILCLLVLLGVFLAIDARGSADIAEEPERSVDKLWKNADSPAVRRLRKEWATARSEEIQRVGRELSVLERRIEKVYADYDEALGKTSQKLVNDLKDRKTKALRERADLDAAVALDALIKRLQSDFADQRTPRPSIDLAAKKKPAKNSMRFNGHSYLWFDRAVTWNVAQEYCRSLGGHLMRIDSDAEFEFLRDKLRWPKDELTWVDGNDEEKEGHFVDYQGKPLRYARWKSGDPNNWSGFQHCAVVGGDGSSEMMDELGANRHGFLCEWDYE